MHCTYVRQIWYRSRKDGYTPNGKDRILCSYDDDSYTNNIPLEHIHYSEVPSHIPEDQVERYQIRTFKPQVCKEKE